MAGLTNLKLLADFFNKIGPARRFAATQQFSRSKRETDIKRASPEPNL
jgi:hypothetical protein